MRELTKAEEEIMQVLWELEKAFVKEIIIQLPEPKPAYNTVSTIVRILQKKGFVGHESFGKTHRYFPKVDRETYSKGAVGRVLSSYFEGSVSNLVSFFVKEKDVSIADLEQLLDTMKTDQSPKNTDV